MDSFRPKRDFFICFHNDTVSFLCYEKSVSEKYSCGQIRMITYLQIWNLLTNNNKRITLRWWEPLTPLTRERGSVYPKSAVWKNQFSVSPVSSL